MLYLDTSAALKLVGTGPETPGPELWIAPGARVPRLSSRLLRIELLRAVWRRAPQRVQRVHAILSAVALLSLDEAAPVAEAIGDPLVRSLDAIHLATAFGILTDLTAFVCYDKRLCASAHALGLPVESPT